MKQKKLILHTFTGDFGQMVKSATIQGKDLPKTVDPQDFLLHNCFTDCCCTIPSKGVQRVQVQEDCLELEMDSFLYRSDFRIEGTGTASDIAFTKEDAQECTLEGDELFLRCQEENGLIYRLYQPKVTGPRPLILFLHGGGECGTDNMAQLTGTLGAIKLAQRYNDMVVMAPQAPTGNISMETLIKQMEQGSPTAFAMNIGADPDAGPESRGWNREYLGKISNQIRKMIGEGKVDPTRVYVIGMSMGGGGTIRAVSCAPDLFAAAVPICPTMNGETYPMLENFPQVPVYLATAYIDHQPARHVYIFNACKKLWAEGRTDVKYTIFTPEDLARYGVVDTPQLTKAQIRGANHNSWTLVLHNEYGILDWMVSQRKKG